MPKLIDLTGLQFGKLTVIKRAEKNTSNNKPRWECKCECGNYVTVAGSHLRSGHTKSCGCLQAEVARKINYKDITNQRFGKLTALKDVGSNKQGNALWKCRCDCGNEIIVKGLDLRNGHTQSCGCMRSLGEEKISKILKENKILFKNQQTFENCRFPNTNALAKFDFYLLDHNILIEYDGKQHFNNTNGWEDFEKLKYRDKFKNQWCKDNNIILIRIPYWHFNNIKIEDLLEDSKYRVV